jgi:hypothetical protein
METTVLGELEESPIVVQTLSSKRWWGRNDRPCPERSVGF